MRCCQKGICILRDECYDDFNSRYEKYTHLLRDYQGIHVGRAPVHLMQRRSWEIDVPTLDKADVEVRK
jgi:hypothetical protein